MRRLRALPFRALPGLALALALVLAPAAAPAAGGSYASAGSGRFAASLWWLDFSGFNSATAASGQPFGFTLPNGAGTLSTTVTVSGNGSLNAVAEPAWSGGGAFGHGAYDNVTGSPVLYWLNQPGNAGTVSLTGLVMKDAGGNARSFALYTADGENTNNPETIVYTSGAAWKLVDTVNYYPSFSGSTPPTAGIGTTSVTESGPTANDSNYNASIVLGTANPGQVSVALSNNEGVLFALAIPTVNLTVNVAGRVSAADQFTLNLGYTSPAFALKTVNTAGTAGTATSGTVPVIGTNGLTLGVSLAAGSPSALSYYSGSMACTNGGPGAASFAGVNTALPSGAGTSFTVTPQSGDAIACTLTLTPMTQALTGSVYGDVNHDASLDNGETGTGIAGLFVKLAASSGGVCQTPATAAAAVNAGSGAFSLAGIAPGTYCLTLTNSSALANTGAYVPPGYVGTEAGSGVRNVTVSASPAPVQNFGLYGGAQLNVQVFNDGGTGGGSANDGIQNGTEAGIAGVTVTVTDGGAAVASAITGGGGAALLWLPGSTVGHAVTVVPAAPTGDLPTGGGAGTTGGTYVRPAVTFTVAAGASYGGVAFGLVPPNVFAPAGLQSAQAGGTVFHPHTFTAGSAGQVTFGVTAAYTPALAGWSEVLYLDNACTGQFASGDALLTGAVGVKAGQQVCVLLKEFVPAAAPPNAEDRATVSANFAYSGAAAPAGSLLTVVDTTTVVGAGATTLTKQVENLNLGGAYGTTNSAQPGNVLQYQLVLTNAGTAALSTVVVNDSTPAFTTFASAACPTSLPAGLSGCSVSTLPPVGGQGALQWTFTGSLAPGAQVAVTYQVTVAQ